MCQFVDGTSVEVKTEAEDVTDPTTGMCGLSLVLYSPLLLTWGCLKQGTQPRIERFGGCLPSMALCTRSRCTLPLLLLMTIGITSSGSEAVKCAPTPLKCTPESHCGTDANSVIFGKLYCHGCAEPTALQKVWNGMVFL